MTKITITLPTKKAGKHVYFTIEFALANFDLVIDTVSSIKTIDELYANKLWKVI
jgi:hypothetical protein